MDLETCSPVVSHFKWPDYLVCFLMLLVSAAIGVYYGFKRKESSTNEILMGGRKMATFPMAMSLLASFMSAITLLGNPAEMYNYGTQFVMIGVAYFFATAIAAYLFMPVFHRLGLTSAYEYLEMRFSRSVRLFGCITFVIHMVSYMPIVVYAPALALNQVTGIDTFAAVTVIFIVCIFYTSIGGIKAVIWTDTFQVMMMFAGMVAVVIRGNSDVGGFGAVWSATQRSGRAEFFNLDWDPRARQTLWNMVIGGTFLWSSTYSANQAQIQRYLTVPTEKQAINALWINGVGLVVLLLVCCWAGLVMYVKYAACDPLAAGLVKASDQLMPLFVMDTMADYPGVPGLFVAGIFSGALSSVSTGLSALSAITLKDFIGGCFGIQMEDSKAARLSKWISVAYGMLSLGLVFVVAQLGAVLQAALSVHGIVGGPILGVFSLGVFVPWVNSKGAFAGAITGLLFMSWMGGGAQYVTALGQMQFPMKETSVTGCNCTIADHLLSNQTIPEYPDVFPIFAVSYMWYAIIGWLVTVVVAIVVSFATGFSIPKHTDIHLLSPVFVRLMDSLSREWQTSLGWPHKEERNARKQTEMQLLNAQ
ncbi:sodium-coupled monocarboxylate transporter 1-like [Neocloeon triangulifer]|uniref:sodium-coupled monocarboxylate transporter 1-like n=1 Tax=Neocloeon triangulifer TaxID=2078957 RepID=UPI00286EDE14|nr:sodium-coupled monocarboxylate transporter 1-like [Neocloeon triangulifer]